MKGFQLIISGFTFLSLFQKSSLSPNSEDVSEEDLTKYDQEDEVLVDIIRKHYLHPPSRAEYNFTRSPPRLGGQFGQPIIIDEIFNVSKSSYRLINQLQECSCLVNERPPGLIGVIRVKI